MKKITFLAIAVMVAITAIARDRLYISRVEISAGQTIDVPIMLANDTTYCALQTDLYLPHGLYVATDDDEYVINLTSRASSHTISTNKISDGIIRIFIPSYPASAFTGNSGAVAVMKIKASNTFTDTQPIGLCNSVAIEMDGTKHNLVNCWTTAGAKNPCDVNGDNAVTAADISCVVNVLAGIETAETYQGRADVNGDNAVTAADISGVVNYLAGLE